MMRVRVCEHIAGVYRASMSVRCHELSGSTASCAKGDGMAEEKMCKQRVGRPHVPALPGEWGYFGVGSEFGVGSSTLPKSAAAAAAAAERV